MLKKILLILLIFVILFFAGAVGLYFWITKDLPDIRKIEDYKPPLTTVVYSRNKKVIGYFYKEKRFFCALSNMSKYVPIAFLAAEDSDFYHHKGIDFFSILRAAIKNLEAGSIVQGGSTITQQVVKSLFLTPKKSYRRKLKEAILAYRLEKYLTKDEILTIYLNQIYLGHGAYGVEAAARTYFGKHASQLNLAEAAMLAGLPKAPSSYDPYLHFDRAKKRQKYVLNRLLSLGWITKEMYEEALNYPLKLTPMEDPTWKIGPYYLEEVRRWLIDHFGEKMTYTGGLIVYTAMDIEHQKAAEEALRYGLVASTKRRGWRGPIKHFEFDWEADEFLKQQDTKKCIEKLKKGEWIKVVVADVRKEGAVIKFGDQIGWISVKEMRWCRKPDPTKAPEEVPPIDDATEVLRKNDLVFASLKKESPNSKYRWILSLEQEPLVEGALLSLDPRTGDVLALVGGYDFNRSQFNRATQAKRQPGSAFKPIVYSVAIDNGYTPASMILDAPIVIKDKEGRYWKPENYEETVYGPTLLRTALVKSRNLVTIRIAQNIGIKKIIQRAKELEINEEFPNNLSVSLGSVSLTLLELCRAYTAFATGGYVVEPRFVLKVEDVWGNVLYESKVIKKKVLSSQTAYIMSYLLKEVVRDGTGWRARVLKRPVAGKTGTTNDQKDAWFIGFTPYLLTGVFVGFDEPKPMGKYETGSRAACPIWVKYRLKVEDKYPVEDFPKPEGIVMARIDPKTGLLAPPGEKKAYLLPFKAGTQPTKIAPVRSETPIPNAPKEELLKELF